MPALEKRYDQDESSGGSSEEDFVSSAGRAPSRAGSAPDLVRAPSRSSTGSRSSRREKAVSSSSSESTDSEEEAELRAELANVDVEAGTVRGAPVEGRVERVMRSITKGGSSRAQTYAAVAGDAERSGSRRSGRSEGSRRSKGSSRRSSHRNYSLGAGPIAGYADDPDMGPEKPPKQRRQDVAVAGAAAGLPAAPVKRKRRWWIWVLLLLVLVLAVIGIYFGFFYKKSLTDVTDLASNSTAAADQQNSTMTNSTSGPISMPGMTAPLPSSASGALVATGLSTGMSEGGSFGAGSTPSTVDNGQYHPLTTSASAPLAPGATSLQSPAAATGTPAQPVDSYNTATIGDQASVSITGGGTMQSPETPTLDGMPRPTNGPAQQGSQDQFGHTAANANTIQTDPGRNPPQGAPQQTGQSSPTSPVAAPFALPSVQAPQGGSYNQQIPTDPSHHGQPWQGQPHQGQPNPNTAAVSGGSEEPAMATPIGLGPVIVNFPTTASSAAPAASTGAGEGAVPIVWSPSNGAAQPGQQEVQHPFRDASSFQAQKPESFQNMTGNGTWFESSQHYGACGFATDDEDFVVALSNQTWTETSPDGDSPSTRCGAEVLVTNMQNGLSVKAWVTEHCAYCVGERALDLSKPVFKALSAQSGGLDIGVVPLIWGFTGNVTSAAPARKSPAGGTPKPSGSASSAASSSPDASATSWLDSWFGDGNVS